MLKKMGEHFSAGLHPILRSEERFCRPQKNYSFEVNYLFYVGWRSADFLQDVLSPKIFARPVPTYLF
jgi:hypothetical protein